MRLIHCSDLHIRNFKRHDEYRKSFKNLYKSLREKQPDIIVITGDSVHTKVQISPELVQLCAEYFGNLAKIAPLHLILGNHDFSPNNLSRLDALTPIVEALNNPRIHYYKKSGIYPVVLHNGLIQFVVFSCFDDDWPKEEDISKTDVNIGLYHGFVRGARLQNGMLVGDECPHRVGNFLKLVDYLMLGDIHKQQIVDMDYRAAYCGSYPQQNYGESTRKGYLLWDIKSKTEHEVDFVQLPNVCPYYTVELEDDLKLSENLYIQKQARIRVLSRQLSVFEKESLDSRIRNLYEPHELVFKDDLNAHRQEIKISSVNTNIENLNDLTVQEKLIKQFLKTYKLKKNFLESILEINQKYDVHIKKNNDTLRNIQYRLGKMKWSNTFSCKEDNEFDFSKRKGITGIFGKSGVGKSSLAVDIPLYCMFNKISKKVTKNDLIINENKEECFAEIESEIGKDIYKIKRRTYTYLKGSKKNSKSVIQGRTEVDFKIIRADGTIENKNGATRADTDDNIRQIFGTAEDFIDTCVAPQWQLLNFIQYGGTERQKLIGRYFDIDIFNKKHELAKKELKKISAQLDVYDNSEFEESTKTHKIHLKKCEKQFKEVKRILVRIDKEKAVVDRKIENLRSQVVNIRLDSSLTAEKIEQDVQLQEVKCLDKENEIDNSKYSIEQIAKRINSYKKELESFDISLLQKQCDKCEEFKKRITKNSLNVGHLAGNLFNISEKMEELKQYPCVVNSDCCMLKELKNLKKEENNLNDEKKKLLKEMEITSVQISKNVDAKSKLERYEEINREFKVEKPSLVAYKNALKSQKLTLEQLRKNIEDLKETKEEFIKNKQQIIRNIEFGEKIKIHKLKREKIEENLREAHQRASEFAREIGATQSSLDTIKRQQGEYEALKGQYEAYDYFIQAMSKDGISKKIIADNLGIINQEIRKILSKGVNFLIELESSESGKEIEIYFKHEKSKPRIIEICGGMEQSVAAFAIRAALLSVTTLPRLNMYILDEPFSALDPEYMDAVSQILEYLKTLFESVIIITHIDSLKDVVDHVVEVERDDDGYTRICE